MEKATSLATETNAVVPAPGFGDKDRMVKSKSGSAPHLVKVSNCQYLCDSQCPQFKSITICSHVVAAAESNGDLASFVEWYCIRRGHNVPNLMQMAVHGMPPGAGNKGGKVARKKGKPKQAPTDENRVPMNVSSCSPDITKLHHTDATTETGHSSQQSISSSTNTVFQQSSHHQSMDHTSYPRMCSPIHHSPPPSLLLYQSTPFPYGPYPPYQPPYPSLPLTPYSTQLPSSPHQQNLPQTLYSPNHSIMSPFQGIFQQNDYNSDYFKVCFKIGNISICNGCQTSFSQSEEIVIQHAEFRHYTNPRTGLPASKYGNAYYHPKRACIQLKWGSAFDSNKLVVPEAVMEKLTTAQKQQLCQEFVQYSRQVHCDT